jgi:hypothetical protein
MQQLRGAGKVTRRGHHPSPEADAVPEAVSGRVFMALIPQYYAKIK